MNSPQTAGPVTGTLRLGMIGCGAIAAHHMHQMRRMENIEITALADPSPKSIADTLQAWNEFGPKTERQPDSYEDYRRLLDRKDLDALIVCSPNHFHTEHILVGLERGLPVLCEKPLSLEPADVERVIEAQRRAGIPVCISYQSRYRAAARQMRRIVETGQYGAVTAVSAFNCEDWMTPNIGTWRHDPARCPGGMFADANTHQIDLVLWITGLQARNVRATALKRGTPVPICTWGEALLGEREDVPFTFTFLGDAHRFRSEIVIHTEGADFLMRNGHLEFTTGEHHLAKCPLDEDIEADAAYKDPNAAFVAALREGRPTLSGPETVWPVLRFTRAALRSMDSGRPEALLES